MTTNYITVFTKRRCQFVARIDKPMRGVHFSDADYREAARFYGGRV